MEEKSDRMKDKKSDKNLDKTTDWFSVCRLPW